MCRAKNCLGERTEACLFIPAFFTATANSRTSFLLNYASGHQNGVEASRGLDLHQYLNNVSSEHPRVHWRGRAEKRWAAVGRSRCSFIFILSLHRRVFSPLKTCPFFQLVHFFVYHFAPLFAFQKDNCTGNFIFPYTVNSVFHFHMLRLNPFEYLIVPPFRGDNFPDYGGYESEDGKCPIKDFIDSRNLNNRVKVLSLFEILEEKGPNLPRPYADLLKDGIHELRIKLSGDQIKVLYFFAIKILMVGGLSGYLFFRI